MRDFGHQARAHARHSHAAGVRPLLRTAVAGEISRLVGWSDNRRTLYRHDFIEGISTQIKPLLVDILKLSPELARATDVMSAQ